MNISNSHLFVIFNKVHLGYNKKIRFTSKLKEERLKSMAS